MDKLEFLLLLRIVTTPTHDDIYAQGGERITLSRQGADYAAYHDELSDKVMRKEPVFLKLSSSAEIKNIYLDHYEIVSVIYQENDTQTVIGLLPLAGVYKLAATHPRYDLLRARLRASYTEKKPVRLIVDRADIINVLNGDGLDR